MLDGVFELNLEVFSPYPKGRERLATQTEVSEPYSAKLVKACLAVCSPQTLVCDRSERVDFGTDGLKGSSRRFVASEPHGKTVTDICDTLRPGFRAAANVVQFSATARGYCWHGLQYLGAIGICLALIGMRLR